MSSARRPRFFVPHDAIVGDHAVLTGAERHHLRVRRLRPGAHLELFDDRGREFDAVVERLSEERAELSLTECSGRNRESPLDLTLAVACVKADKLDLVVEKATELGVTRIVIFTSARALASASARRVERWQRIAVSAAKQCGRSAVPVIEGPEAIAATAARTADLRLLCWESAATTTGLPERATTPSSVLIAVGPEGGFIKEEVALFQRAGFHVVSLGPRILRAETAAIAAAVFAQQRWGDL
ncbi:MAG TPA: 16S rRNA (uracil(1498)-N(3))-methyltransferase [Candidatus Kryptonia bacterium]|nr:16S rRNA (uracil(1498)-N(3))-methyltransferase [Candidatus Kryptonia bacterium]